ncbi:MAG: GspH/FimT family pseudopilin [Candidatus Moranbacteria bacterium]|nr:GspH/FimT family pseudopilin [Candidatus Moranbacteria bacterium]
MFCKKLFSKGFSFVELMVVIAIIGIMVAVVTVSFGGSRATTRLKAAQDEVTSAIKLAQSYALQGKIPAAGVKPSAYGFKFTSNQSYQIFYVAGGVETALETYSLSDKGVTLTSPAPASTRLTFDLPNGNFGGNSGTLTFTYSGKSRQIDISSGGAVVER